MLLTCVIILIAVADDVFCVLPYVLYDCVILYIVNRLTDNDSFCINRFYLNFLTEEVDKPEK